MEHSSPGQQVSPDERKQGGGAQVKGASGPGVCGQQMSPSFTQPSAGSQTSPEPSAPPWKLDGDSAKAVNANDAKMANAATCLPIRAPLPLVWIRGGETSALDVGAKVLPLRALRIADQLASNRSSCSRAND